MDKKEYKKTFENYLNKYDCTNPQIKFKIDHTYRVADIAYDIGCYVGKFNRGDEDLCWLIGLLHDIGRFEQLKRYGTFSDAMSFDHADFGVEIIFKNELIDKFLKNPDTGLCEPVTDRSVDEEKEIIRLAIGQHNKYKLMEDLSTEKSLFCKVIRDADKIDIFRVICETPFELRMSRKDRRSSRPAREEIMQYIRNHECIKKAEEMTEFEIHLMGCAMAFDLSFDRSREIVSEQGWLSKMLSFEPENEIQKKQMEELREELSYLC